MGKIIPFPVWIIPFTVLKINFELLGSIKKHSVKQGFFIRDLEVGEIIPFPVWIIPFPVLKINFENFGTNKKYVVKEDFSAEALKWEK